MRPFRGRTWQWLVRPVQVYGLAGAVMLMAQSGWACTACYGQSDSPLAAGMNWGILSLLGFILSVLAGVVASFVVLARRSASGTCPDQSALPAQAEFEAIREPEDQEGLSRRSIKATNLRGITATLPVREARRFGRRTRRTSRQRTLRA